MKWILFLFFFKELFGRKYYMYFTLKETGILPHILKGIEVALIICTNPWRFLCSPFIYFFLIHLYQYGSMNILDYNPTILYFVLLQLWPVKTFKPSSCVHWIYLYQCKTFKFYLSIYKGMLQAYFIFPLYYFNLHNLHRSY